MPRHVQQHALNPVVPAARFSRLGIAQHAVAMGRHVTRDLDDRAHYRRTDTRLTRFTGRDRPDAHVELEVLVDRRKAPNRHPADAIETVPGDCFTGAGNGEPGAFRELLDVLLRLVRGLACSALGCRVGRILGRPACAGLSATPNEEG